MLQEEEKKTAETEVGQLQSGNLLLYSSGYQYHGWNVVLSVCLIN